MDRTLNDLERALQARQFGGWKFVADSLLPPETLIVSQDVFDAIKEVIEEKNA